MCQQVAIDLPREIIECASRDDRAFDRQDNPTRADFEAMRMTESVYYKTQLKRRHRRRKLLNDSPSYGD